MHGERQQTRFRGRECAVDPTRGWTRTRLCAKWLSGGKPCLTPDLPRTLSEKQFKCWREGSMRVIAGCHEVVVLPRKSSQIAYRRGLRSSVRRPNRSWARGCGSVWCQTPIGQGPVWAQRISRVRATLLVAWFSGRGLFPVGVEPGVPAAGCEKFVVGALFDHAAILDDHDAVGVADGRQAVGDHD